MTRRSILSVLEQTSVLMMLYYYNFSEFAIKIAIFGIIRQKKDKSRDVPMPTDTPPHPGNDRSFDLIKAYHSRQKITISKGEVID